MKIIKLGIFICFIISIICSRINNSKSPNFSVVTYPAGAFITSGILDVKENDVTDAMKANGFEVIDVVHMNDWVSVIGRKK